MPLPDHPTASPSSAQARVATELRQRILAGEWSTIGRLPAERILSEQVGVSRLTLRGALAHLASEGLVRVRHGSGIQVLDPRRSASLDLFGWLLAAPDNEGQRSFELFAEIVRLRRLVAVDTMLRAAERADEEDVQFLEQLADEQARRTDDAGAYLDGDAYYQRCVIRIAGSTAVELLFNSLQRVLERRRELTLCFMGPLAEHHASYATVHDLLRHPQPQGLRGMAEAAQDMIERVGLERVRRLCLGHEET